jgi:O-antigen ligase
MIPFFLVIAGISLAAIIVLSILRLQRDSERNPPYSPHAVFFSAWLVSTAVFGSYFFALRVQSLFDITIERILFCSVIVFLVTMPLRNRKMRRQGAATEILMLLFLIYCFVSMLLHGFFPARPADPSPWFLFITAYLFPFIAFYFAKYCITRDEDISLVFHCIFFLGVYIALIAPLEFFGLREWIWPRYIGDTSIWLHLDRARGPFLNSAFNGTALICGFVCGVFVLKQKEGLGRLIFSFLLCLFIPAIFFTQTRSVYLGFFLALLGMLFFYRVSFPKWKALALPVSIVVLFLLAQVPNLLSAERRIGGVFQISEVTERLSLLTRSLLIFMDHPLLGVGHAQFGITVKNYLGALPVPFEFVAVTQHNQIMGMLAELGLIGTSLYLSIVGIIFFHLFSLSGKIPRNDISRYNMLLSIGLIMLVVVVNNMFVEPAYCLFINAAFFTFGGIADGLYNRYRPATAQPREVG